MADEEVFLTDRHKEDLLIKTLELISLWDVFRWQWRNELPLEYRKFLLKAIMADSGFLLFLGSAVAVLRPFVLFLAGYQVFPVYPFAEMIVGLWIANHYGEQTKHFIFAYRRARRRLGKSNFFWSHVKAKWFLTEMAGKVKRLEGKYKSSDFRVESARVRFRQAHQDFLLLGLIKNTGYRSYYHPN